MKNRWQDISYIVEQKLFTEASWQDPEIRTKRIFGIIEANKRPEIIERKRAAALKALQNPLYCSKIRNASREYRANPESRTRHSVIMREVAKRPEYREAISMGLKKYWEKPGKKEQRALISAAIWTRPGMREQISASLVRSWDERLRIKSILWGFDNKLPAFSKEEEAEFIKMVKQGNYKARYKFFCCNMGLAEKLAWRIWQNIAMIFPDYEEMDVDLEVVKQEAYAALSETIEKYDPERFGTKFSTLAYISVPHKIIRALHNYGRLVRVPIHAVGVYDGDTLRNAFYVDSIEPESDDNKKNYSDGFSVFHTEELLHQPKMLENNIFSFDSEDDIIEFIREKVPKLSKREEGILRLRIDGMTLKEIGLIIRVSKQRVQQIIAKVAAQASVVIKEING